MRDEKEKILDILEAIEKIEKYAAKGHEAFFEDELIQTWIIHHIMIIGEAAAFFSVNPERIWPVVEKDLPVLYPRA